MTPEETLTQINAIVREWSRRDSDANDALGAGLDPVWAEAEEEDCS